MATAMLLAAPPAAALDAGERRVSSRHPALRKMNVRVPFLQVDFEQ